MDSDSEVFVVDSDMSEEEDSFVSEASENPLPVAKKSKATSRPASNATVARKVLSPIKNGGNANTKKSVEEIYQKKTQLEHILLRPDTYIGSVEPSTCLMFVVEDDRIIEKQLTYTPGLFKIFDEILVNAADNKQRCADMDKIEIEIDSVKNLISVKNNGKGIPVVIHKEHQCYVPTMIFGHLLTGSNFDDNEKKTTGGRNGYGAKLANVFSTEFVVECVNVENGKKFRQVFRNNMSIAEDPIVKDLTAAERKVGDYVRISFSPDLARFNMQSLDMDTIGLFSKRAYDMAGTLVKSNGKKLTVRLNGKRIEVSSFEDYLKMYDGINPPDAYEKSGRWEVGLSASPEPTMKQVSFVNAICTSKGGQHISYIADQVANHLVKTIKKKNKKGLEVKPAQIKNHLCVFVNCLIDNPAFDSQTKEFLTTKPKAFGSSFTLSDKFLKQLDKSPVVEAIMEYASFKDKQALKRKGGVKKSKLFGIPKLDDANCAGTAKSIDCTLIITEGDSAKSLAMSGLSVVGRDFYGVFPLKGKPMNVRDAKTQQVLQNEEIKNLVDILGLKFSTVYDQSNIKTLRYGHLMIMADQDTDGSHIKGLIINFIHHFWPSLLDVPGFLQQFITPIVKVTKGKKTHTFFSTPEYSEWLNSTGDNGKGWTQKYYKGLGTSTSAEAKEYFSNLDLHEVTFTTLSADKEAIDEFDQMGDVLPDVTTSGSDLIDMVFRKTRVEDRKQWLNTASKDIYLDYANVPAEGVKYSDFINREYILFSKYDNERSIPHLIDGFKPSQRKVLYACIKRKLKNEIKVAQLTGYVAEQCAYHHGEQSLQGTIVNMAQNYVGSNNINLLTPSGQFGTRRMGGSDSASARYIFTKLEPITRTIFHPDDDALLNYKSEEGMNIEPEYFVPVIPMVLVNGAEGIGTGWSSSVCNYNPRDIVNNIRRMIGAESLSPMKPFYNGFVGEVEAKGKGSYVVKGIIERISDTEIRISELPIKKSTHAYKLQLEAMMTGDAKKPAELKDIKENHTEATVSFLISADKDKIDEFQKEKDGLYGKFKLTAALTTTNMTLFDATARIVRYESPEEILKEFFNVRLGFYVKRKDLLIEKLVSEQNVLANKVRFVEEVCSGKLIVTSRKRRDILDDLVSRGYMQSVQALRNKAPSDPRMSDDEDTADLGDLSEMPLIKGYEYLLGMKIWSLTFEKAERLRVELEEKTKMLAQLTETSSAQLWLKDLNDIEEALDLRDVAMAEAEQDEKRAQRKNQKQRIAKTKKVVRKLSDWQSDEDMTSGDNADFESNIRTCETTRVTLAGSNEGLVKPVPKRSKPATKKIASRTKIAIPVLATTITLIDQPQIGETKNSNLMEFDFESDDDMDGRSLIDRMKDKLYVSPQGKQAAVKVKRSLAKKSSPTLDLIDARQYDLASVTPALIKDKRSVMVQRTHASKVVVTKPVKRFSNHTASPRLDKSDSDVAPSQSFGSNDNGGRIRRNVKRTTYVFSDDEDESSFAGSESD